MRRKRDLKQPRNFSIGPDEWKALGVLAHFTGMSRSSFIGFLIRVTFLKVLAAGKIKDEGLFAADRMADSAVEDVISGSASS